ncbi:hypothetical protein PT520_11895 [Aliarcobacter butzleri]|uniref:Uncharacterized protein n=1 Tax=Aliarcobacter butzleri TaxID=28197 RepID=A0AAW6VTZ8_9BACT|nr:hypothetical protein [Aliarcobacter butzleri]MDK2063219.1 hypothetical protein [Aliarcobacter butzleri]MDK2071155.1 hypothetical protein [Aliarcobacter butzleri]
MLKEEIGRLKAIKSVYSKEAFNNLATVKYGDTTYVGWLLLDADTIEELESKYSDEQILDFHNDLMKNKLVR